jgi:type I restriction enzyme S subunit
MKKSLERVPIESLCTSISSGGTPLRSNGRYWEAGIIPWFKTGELKDWYVENAEEKITEEGLLNSSAKIFPPNTVLMAMYGDGRTITSLGILRNEAATNQASCAMIANPAKCHFLYLFYALKYHRHELLKLVVAGAQRNLSSGIIRNFNIISHPQPVQKRIVELLSGYDELIENNRRRMGVLEQAARLLYQEWFVRLCFPGHEHTKTTKGIPQGWETKRIGDIADCVGGGTPSTSNPSYWDNGDITWVTPTDVTRNDHFVLLDAAKKITEAGLKNSSARLVPSHAVLMTSRASVGFFAVAGKEVCTNQGFISIVPADPVFSAFLLFQLNERVEEIRAMGSGSTFPEVSRGKFREFQILMPPRRLVQNFDEQVTLILKQIRVLKQQNQKLRAARDLLLPRLMSGGLQV